MAMTTLPEALETSTPEAPPQEPTTGRQGLFGWLVVAVALVAASVLVVLAVSADDPAAPRPWYSAEHSSIAAIDHAAHATVAANRGSITAIDHAAATPSAARQWYSAEHGSVTAIDHATATAASPADVSAERGSITAIDHEAGDDDDTTGAG